MVKPHKYAWTGVDIETTLTFEQLANMAERAAQQSTGDLTNGRYKVVSTRTNERRIEFLINDYLISYKKCMVFHLDFAHREDRTWMTSQIDWYEAERPKLIGLPAGGKAMVAHHTYMQFARSLADQVRAVDSRARVIVREGKKSKSPLAQTEPATGGSAPQQRPAPPAPASLRPPASHSQLGLHPARAEAAPPVRPPSAQIAPAERAVVPRSPSSSPGAGASWQLRLPDGDLVAVPLAVVLGRNPTPPAMVPAATQVALQDQWLSVSKTHAVVQVRDGDLWVTDLHSTNGTWLRDRDGDEFACEPGTPQRVDVDWEIRLGEFGVRVARS